MHRLLLPAFALVLGCNAPASPLSSTSASASSPAPAVPAPSASVAAPADPLRDLLGALPPEVQAHEGTLAHEGYRALLAPVMDLVRKRFEGVADEQVQIQAVPLQGAARVVLLAAPGSKARPLMMAFDEQRTLGWYKERPIHDLDAAITKVALCPGPAGDLLLVFHDPPTGTIGARRWDRAGGLLADFRLGSAEQVDALSALFWPGRGWLLVTTTGGQVHGQMLSERGKVLWGSEGKLLGTGARPGAVALTLDTAVSAVAIWPGSGAAGRHALAQRLDFEGTTLWRAPVDLGDAAETGTRPRVERVGNGKLRVELPRASGSYRIELDDEGKVLVP